MAGNFLKGLLLFYEGYCTVLLRCINGDVTIDNFCMEPNITRVIGCVIDPIQKEVKINGCYQFNNVDAP